MVKGRHVGCITVIAAAGLFANPATAALLVSGAPTHNVTCSAGVCTATARYAVLNKSDLAGMLASSDVTVRTTHLAKDIDFKVGLSWVSANRLTLDAFHSITFEKVVAVTGPGALTLTTNDGGTGGTLSFGSGGRIHFWDAASSLVINGASYTLVTNLATLASDIAASPTGDYALADNYDATPDGTYAHSPVATAFGGAFEGLGNTISKLTIQNVTVAENVGLFAAVGSSGTIENVSLTSISVGAGAQKSIGGLVAMNSGQLSGDFVSGVVAAGNESSGGLLAGANSGTIVNCHSAGWVREANMSTAQAYLGGLVGLSKATIDHSFSTANVTGRAENDGNDSGGLVGAAPAGTITNSYATGTAAGYNGGGLVGAQESHVQSDLNLLTIGNSYATGAASGYYAAGGLAGYLMSAAVSGSHASGNASGNYAGGLVGYEGVGSVSLSWASGMVTGVPGTSSEAGGLVGTNYGLIENSYATGVVQTGNQVGGFVGRDWSTTYTSFIHEAYEIGAVSGGTYTGGFAGFNRGGTRPACTHCYWDTTTSGASTGFGRGSGDGIEGLTSTQLQSGLPAGFDPSIWAQNPGINGGFPYLISNPPS